MKGKKTGEIQSMPTGIGIGVLASMLTTLIGSGIFAWVLSKEYLFENMFAYAAVIILLMSSIIGSCVATGIVKEKKLSVSLLAGAGYFMSLLACTALLFRGQYRGVAVTFLVILAGDICVALIGLKGNKRSTTVRHKYRTG